MAGYMGFGMQNWLYKTKSRKPFEKRKSIPSFSALPKYQRNFQLKKNKKHSNKLAAFLTIAIICCFLLVGFYMSNQFVSYSEKHRSELRKTNIKLDQDAFNFLMESGILELKNQRPEIAYTKFKLALLVFPENKRANQLYLETLSVLCSEDIIYCELLNSQLSSM